MSLYALLLAILVADLHRIFHILLDLHRELWEWIGSLGHQLQYALELLRGTL